MHADKTMRRDADTRRVGDVRHLRGLSIREVTYTSRFRCQVLTTNVVSAIPERVHAILQHVSFNYQQFHVVGFKFNIERLTSYGRDVGTAEPFGNFCWNSKFKHALQRR